jgi:threonine dehydrogenase-like Zn-dependent dehydrogenase
VRDRARRRGCRLGLRPGGQFAIASAKLLGAEKVIAIDSLPYRLRMARERAGADETIDFEHEDVMDRLKDFTGGRGLDACIDAVGMEAHAPGIEGAYDTIKHLTHLQTGRPAALREAAMACRPGGHLSIAGVYGGFVDKVPMGAIMNKSLTIRTGQTHVQRYMRPLLERIQGGEIDPSFIITHTLPLAEAPYGYDIFRNRKDGCVKVVLKP